VREKAKVWALGEELEGKKPLRAKNERTDVESVCQRAEKGWKNVNL